MALRKVVKSEFDRNANIAGVKKEDPIRKVYLGAEPQLDDTKVVVAEKDNNGKLIPKEIDGKLAEPTLKGLDKNGSPVYNEPVITITQKYDPETRVDNIAKEVEKGSYFTPEENKIFQQFMANIIVGPKGIAAQKAAYQMKGGKETAKQWLDTDIVRAALGQKEPSKSNTGKGKRL